MIRDDEELRAWMADWRAAEPGAARSEEMLADLVRRVKRRSRGLRLLAAGELALVAAALACLASVALRLRQPVDVAAMAALGLLALGALAFGFWNRRGLWRPAAETAAAHLSLALARCRRRGQALRAGGWLLAAETAVFIPWIWHRLHTASGSPGPADFAAAYGYLASVVGAAAAILGWLAAWTRRELAGLEAVARDAGLAGLDNAANGGGDGLDGR